MNSFSNSTRDPESTRWHKLKQWMIEFEAALDGREALWDQSGRIAKLEARIGELEANKGQAEDLGRCEIQ